jgi:hypothetical protein
MATIRDLFKSQQKEIYGRENIRIESRGLINPPRGAALLASSPNAIADLIGGQIGGAIGGIANRPSDTIFRDSLPFRKPISLGRTEQGLRNSIDAGKDYFVKQSPSPNSILAQLSQGASNPQGIATSLAIKGVTKGGIKELKDKLKNKTRNDYNNFSKFSDNKTSYNLDINGKQQRGVFAGKNVQLRTISEKGGWSSGADYIQKVESFTDKIELNEAIKRFRDTNQVWVTFKKYGNKTIVPFIGAISALNEDIQPEWTNFRYIGSPFKVNRYQGVERSLKFNLKLYYLTAAEKNTMIKKVNYLKSLTFPYEQISEIKYGDSKETSQYAFSPNLVYISIGDMYKNVFGYIDSLSFNVDENTSWPNADANGNNDGRDALTKFFGLEHDNHLYPSVIDVSISMKIIENHITETDKGGITRYKYNFDGITYDTEYDNKLSLNTPFNILEQKEPEEPKKTDDIANWTRARSID